MNSATAQIVASYEEADMTVEEIARVEELDIAAVRATLFTHSGRYRSSVQGADIVTTKGEDKHFESDDNDLALKVIREIAQMSEDDSTRLKAAMFIRNDKRGRLDAQKGLKNLSLNVQVINEHMQKAARAIATKVLPASKPVEQTINI